MLAQVLPHRHSTAQTPNTNQLKRGRAAPTLCPRHPATAVGAVAKHAGQTGGCSTATDTCTPEREDGGKGQKSGSCCLQAKYYTKNQPLTASTIRGAFMIPVGGHFQLFFDVRKGKSDSALETGMKGAGLESLSKLPISQK